MSSPTVPLWMRFVLPQAGRVAEGLDRLRAAGVEPVPNLWQITLGVYRMWWRLISRPETVGTCRDHAPRRTWRARLMHPRFVRLPFLLHEKAVNPVDFSGLASSPERMLKHLIGAHHDRRQFAYDLEILRCYPGGLEELRERAERVVVGEDPRAEWLRDLVVFDGYHESLLRAVEDTLEHGVRLPPDEADDPDISFLAYLRWCAAQPPTPAATVHAVRAGTLSFAPAGSRP